KPPHDLVSGFLASLRGEPAPEAHPEPAAAAAAPLSSVSATPAASSAGSAAYSDVSPGLAAASTSSVSSGVASASSGVAAAIPSTPVVSAFRRKSTPVYASLAMAAVVVAGIGWYLSTRPGST